MKIGITGAAGFVGKHLVPRIRSLGHDVKSFKGDLSNISEIGSFVKDCDQIIHLASIFSNNFDDLMSVNVSGTRNIVEACKEESVKKIIFTSSGAVYGEPANGLLSCETDNPSPNTLYGISKLYAEEYIKYSGVRYIILRFSNIFGPGSNKGVVYNFIKSAKDKSQISIFGTGNQKRNFLFINDAIESIIQSVRYNGNSQIINVADSKLYSLIELAELLEEHGLKFKTFFTDSDETNQLRVLSEDINKAKRILNWRPKVGLEKGIANTIKSIT